MYDLRTVARFTRYVKRGDPDSCWNWTGAHSGGGYGGFRLGSPRRMRRSHIVAWEIHHGRPVAPGLFVCHSCDNPPCCNPAHLGSGTHAINMGEMVERGRSSRGQDRPSAKLTDRDVRAIRRRYAAGGVRQRDLADDYGVVQSLISRVINGHIWGHVA